MIQILDAAAIMAGNPQHAPHMHTAQKPSLRFFGVDFKQTQGLGFLDRQTGATVKDYRWIKIPLGIVQIRLPEPEENGRFIDLNDYSLADELVEIDPDADAFPISDEE